MIFHLRRGAAGLTALALALTLLVGFAVAADEPDPDPMETARAAFQAAETPEARLEIATTFLSEYPDHPELGDVIQAGTDVLAGPMDDTDGAIALALKELARSGNLELTAQIQAILLKLYAAPEYQAEMKKLLGEMYDVEEMTYVEFLEAIRAATGAEAWSEVDRYIAPARHLATPEAFRAAYPDEKFSDEYIQEAGRNRQGLLMTYAGWSAANQGDMEKAKKEFEAAADHVRPSYFGLPDNDLYRYWGKTLVKAGENERGIEMLALASIYNRDHDAGEVAEAAYGDLGSNLSWEDYLWQLRLENAPTIDNFTATDYADATLDFVNLKGRKATLLAFWFPT